jgi:hypothetical protein
MKKHKYEELFLLKKSINYITPGMVITCTGEGRYGYLRVTFDFDGYGYPTR